MEPALQIEFSGERTACITAGKYDEDEGIKPDRTRYQVGYQAWLEDKGFCLPTTELGEEKPCMLYWPKVGVIDSGLDVTRCPEANYIEATGVCDPPDPSNELHWDLNHRANNASICNQMFGSGESMDPMSECPDWIVGGTFHCAGPLGARYCHDSGEQTYDFSDKAYDGDGHGTAVAAIIAGDYFSLGDGDDQGYQAAATDSDPDEGFYRGVGIAPSARINVGKMGDFDEQNPLSITANDFAFLVRRMVLDDTRFFNCSWNLHSPYQGRDEEEYTLFSKIADLLVRDGDYGIGSDNREITMVFSAGNGGPPVDGMFALSPGNAKNVISVGANNGWDSPYPDEGEELCPIRDPAGKYKIENIGRFSLRSYVYETGDGEALPRYKPDLVASGTHLAAAASRHYDPDQTPAYVYYGCFQGTSAAAPAVTASAVLAETWYWNRIIDPQHRKRASPAMIKAMLVAHADSLHGGIDVADQIDEDQYATLNHAPSLPQGWGRVNLNELFQEQVDGQNKVPVLVYDQHTHLFTESGEVWQTSVDVADDGEDLIIVMVYTDLHAEPSEELESLTVNDLDLKVGQFEFFDPHVFYGNRFETDTEYSRDYPLLTLNDQVPDRHNTVEVVRIPGDVLDGPVSIQVRAYDVAMEAVPDPDSNSPNQDFALYIFNAELH